jgi:capsular exopolysaccharide synthesis family protein
MSRVFEALERAGDAKKGKGKKVPAEASGNGQAENGQRLVSVEAFVPRAGNGFPSEEIALPPAHNGAKPWRERLEELLFGWDLRRYKNYPLVALEKESAAAEQYKILREQMRRLQGETGARSFAVTSPVKQDGKTMVAVNLASSIALGFDQPVLLIDGDLRSPDIHRYFGLQRSPGLSEYLTSGGNGNVVSYVQETFLPGLQVLPAGKPHELVSELLANGRMRNLMDEIRAAFPHHQIIVDTPPVLSTADPLVLTRQVEGVVMVVRAGKTPRDHLLKAIQCLNSDKLMGIILNGAEMSAASKYYYYYSSNHN